MHFKTWGGRNVRLYLFRLKGREEVADASGQAWYDMPYIYDPYVRLHKQTGSIVEDKKAGSWVFEAREGSSRPGFLVYGPYDVYPPGEYSCVFSVFARSEDRETVARAEVTTVSDDGDVIVLAQQEIKGNKEESKYRKIPFDFTLSENTSLEFRVFYHGIGLARVEKITMYMAGKDKPLNFLEAEKMVGDIGLVAFAKDASGGKVIEAVAQSRKKKQGEMVYGPNRVYAQGKYTASFLLRSKGVSDCKKKRVAASLIVSDEKNQIVYADRDVDACDLDNLEFTPVPVEFELHRSESLSFRVIFTGEVTLQLDAIEVMQQ
jgi:hypothetical protein